MRRILLAAAALALTGAAAAADDPKPARPAQPRPAAPARLTQLEEEVEVLEAQRYIRQAHIKAAEAAARVAEIKRKNTVRLFDQKVVGKDELALYEAEAQVAQARVEIRKAELKELEVRLKYARKRLEDAKAAGARPAPGVRPVQPRPGDPQPNPRPAAHGAAELKAKIEQLTTAAETKEAERKKAEAELETAKAKVAALTKPGTPVDALLEANKKVSDIATARDTILRDQARLERQLNALRMELKKIENGK
jgi:multidrug resistance efflux pump